MIYLASPLTHDDPEVEEQRYELTSKLVVDLIRSGHRVYSPIVYSFPLAKKFRLNGTWEFWRDFDLHFLDFCQQLWVYKLPGWHVSKGVAAELAYARDRGKPITWIEMEDS